RERVDFAALELYCRYRLPGHEQRNFELVDFRWCCCGENACSSRNRLSVAQVSRILDQDTDFRTVNGEACEYQLLAFNAGSDSRAGVTGCRDAVLQRGWICRQSWNSDGRQSWQIGKRRLRGLCGQIDISGF